MTPETGLSCAWDIRRVGPSDTEAFARAAERFFRQTYGHDPEHVAIMEGHCAKAYALPVIAEELGDPQAHVVLCESGGKIIGIGQMGCAPPLARIIRLYLDQAFHGRGIAPAVLDALLTAARAAGCDRVQLGVWAANDRALAFYRRHGFSQTGTTELALDGHVFKDILMEKPLS